MSPDHPARPSQEAAPELHPFACTHTPELPELLARLNCSLAISTYQAGKVMMVSSDGERLQLLPRRFDTPMGMAVAGNRMAVACAHETMLLSHQPEMGPSYPKQPDTYDTMYLPRQTAYTGAVMMHDLAFGGDGRLVGTNTSFSCLCHLDEEYSFSPIWQPPFISELQPEDRCHLNGLAMADGEPGYVTALGATDTGGGWRDQKLSGGVLLDVASGETVLSGMAMPHSPRLFHDRLYLLLSATGELVQVDIDAGRFDVISSHPGFVRGMDLVGDHLFVGISRLRKTHTFGDLEMAQRQDLICGFEVVHLPSGALVSRCQFLSTCEEIYDICVLPGIKRPGILGIAAETHRQAISIPDGGFWGRIGEGKLEKSASDSGFAGYVEPNEQLE
jgi:uncharacterized protein (TIGR03032 family)